MLKGEKGVTRIVLAIGVVVTVVMVLVIGVYMMAPLIKGSEEFVAKDAALYMNTILAAPEDVVVNIDLSEYISKDKLGEVGIRVEEGNFVCAEDPSAWGIFKPDKCSIFTGSKKTDIGEIAIVHTGEISKTYNPDTRTNKIT